MCVCGLDGGYGFMIMLQTLCVSLARSLTLPHSQIFLEFFFCFPLLLLFVFASLIRIMFVIQ